MPTPDALIRGLHAAYAAPDAGATDAALLSRVAAGTDAAAFELLVRRHAAAVWKVCRGVTGDHHAAEDAFQAAFLALATKARGVRGDVAGWLYRVAYHAALKARPRRAAGVSRLLNHQQLDEQIQQPAYTGRSPEDDELVHAELNRLADKYRVPVALCHLHGLTQAEAAARLGVPVGTVATRVRRGLDRLRTALVRRGVTAAAVAAVLSTPAVGPAASLIPQTLAAAVARPAVILHLMNGALAAMTSVKPKLVAAAVLAAAIAGGGWVVGQGPGASGGRKPAVEQAGGSGAPGGLGAVAPPATGAPAQPLPLEKTPFTPGDEVASAQQRARSQNNLKQILLAMHNYHDTFGTMPRDIRDDQGQPLLSWRVELLPYMEQAPLFLKFNREEPWDSATNKPLLAQMPGLYLAESGRNGTTDTLYQGFRGAGTVFDPLTAVGFNTIVDGTSNTLGVAEMGPPVPWTKPADVLYSSKKPLPKIALPFANVFQLGMMDGSVRAARPDLPGNVLRMLVERADGQNLDWRGMDAKMVPKTVEEKVEAAKLAAQVAAARAFHTELTAVRDVMRRELAKLDGEAAGGGPDQLELEVELARLRDEAKLLEAEIAALKKKTAALRK